MESQFCSYKINTHYLIRVFTEPTHYQLLFDALTFIKKKYKLDIFAYALMPFQLNIVTDESLADQQESFTTNLKTITRNEIIKLLEVAGNKEILDQLDIAKGRKKYRLWEVNPEFEILTGFEKLATRIDMVHKKPVEAELVSTPIEYPYSSAKFYKEKAPTEIKITDYRALS